MACGIWCMVDLVYGIFYAIWSTVYGIWYLSWQENFKLCWLPYLVLMKSLKFFIPWWLENGGTVQTPKQRYLATNTPDNRYPM